MLFTDDELYEIDRYLQRWIKNWHVGGKHKICEYKKYDNKVWLQISRAIRYAEMSLFDTGTNSFLLRCKYDGIVYRVMEYSGSEDGILYPMNHYQSWVKDICSLKPLAHKIKNPVIIEAYAHGQDYAIDVDMVMSRSDNSSRYKKGNEVTVPVHKDNILRIYTAKFNIVDDSVNTLDEKIDIPKELWFMDDWYNI